VLTDLFDGTNDLVDGGADQGDGDGALVLPGVVHLGVAEDAVLAKLGEHGRIDLCDGEVFEMDVQGLPTLIPGGLPRCRRGSWLAR
jgi:hypothetical protein